MEKEEEERAAGRRQGPRGTREQWPGRGRAEGAPPKGAGGTGLTLHLENWSGNTCKVPKIGGAACGATRSERGDGPRGRPRLRPDLAVSAVASGGLRAPPALSLLLFLILETLTVTEAANIAGEISDESKR